MNNKLSRTSTASASSERASSEVMSEAQVKERILAAFPEINLERFIDEQGTNNRHNVEERFGATVNSVMQWVKDSNGNS